MKKSKPIDQRQFHVEPTKEGKFNVTNRQSADQLFDETYFGFKNREIAERFAKDLTRLAIETNKRHEQARREDCPDKSKAINMETFH